MGAFGDEGWVRLGAIDREWFHENRDAIGGVRKSPSGRIPRWAVEDALGQPPVATTWRAPLPTTRRKPRGRGRLRLRLGTVGVLALVAALYLTPSLFDRYVLPAALPYLPGADVPPRGVEAADGPLGAPPAAPASNAYKLHTSPVTEQDWIAYDPCRPIHYVVRPTAAPAGSEGLVEEAVAEVAAATGLTFVADGTTAEPPSAERDLFQPEMYGKRWVPVLITWSDPAEVPGLAGDVIGLGGSDYAQTPGQPLVYVGGQVHLDAADAAATLAYPGGRDLIRATIMHELAHVVGLGHVEDPTQLMYAENSSITSFGDGDRAGLAVLGAGPCAPGL